MSRTIWYFPLESVPSRFSIQLCNYWMPDAFSQACSKYNSQWHPIIPDYQPGEIKHGVVLDAVGRGRFSLLQVEQALSLLDQGIIKTGDALFFQDFWTPGIEAIYYAADLLGMKLNYYAFLCAQTVDRYDFTYPMRSWMRKVERGYAIEMDGIFLGSSIHKLQLNRAGFHSPMYIIGQAIDCKEVLSRIPQVQKRNQVAYCSRFDWEKQPLFMLKVASRFLKLHPEWEWVCTTSRCEPVSNDPAVILAMQALASQQPRFKILSGLSKDEYYEQLALSKIHFNSSLQDYVSYTLLESCLAGCDICYPNFRSFPECVPANRLYHAFTIHDALRVLQECIDKPQQHLDIPLRCDQGRLLQADIIASGEVRQEVNIWG